MNSKLDKNLQLWLTRLSEQWAMSIEQVAVSIGSDEIYNRLKYYPIMYSILSPSTAFDLEKFNKASRECWVLGSKADRIRLNYFVAKATYLGYSTPSGSVDWAGAALLASVILTILYPQRFVDFRQSRWHTLAEAFGYEHPPSGEKGYGAKLIWAGKFAKDISNTNTFRQYWPEGEALWIISGVCWTGPSPSKPEADPPDIDEQESFPEGAEKRRLHLIRERNQTVVQKAKQLGLERDSLLKCQVCNFSFVERYGEHGRSFIEAHHTQPMATLKPGSPTKVEDIALLCANCHRMIHQGDHTLTLQELRDKLRN